MATKSKEEMLVLLYTLNECGGRPSKARAIRFIIENNLLVTTPQDHKRLESAETKLENRLAWTRQDLKERGLLIMRERGFWEITLLGREKLREYAIKSLNWSETEEPLEGLCIPRWERFSPQFLARLQSLGRRLKGENQDVV